MEFGKIRGGNQHNLSIKTSYGKKSAILNSSLCEGYRRWIRGYLQRVAPKTREAYLRAGADISAYHNQTVGRQFKIGRRNLHYRLSARHLEIGRIADRKLTLICETFEKTIYGQAIVDGFVKSLLRATLSILGHKVYLQKMPTV